MNEDKPPNWDRIVDRHARRVFLVAYRILGSTHDAEDVSQDVFVELFRIHRSEPVQSWVGLLVRLSTLRAIDRLRRSQPHCELHESDHTSTIQPFDKVAARELADWLRNAICQLPDQQAAIFSMSHFETLSRDEIASTFGISPEAVSTSLHKAKQRLVSQLALFQAGNLK